jgi:uncharacterized protein
MYSISVPVIVANLNALASFLKKAEADVEARKFDKAVVLNTRLYPDMFPLAKQVQLVTDFAKGCGARLSGTAIPSYTDDEKTFEDLYARINKTVGFLNGLDEKAFSDAATREVTMKVGGKDLTMSGEKYFTAAFLPNFFFHMTTAYNILRAMGAPLGKSDFMGRT